MSMHELPRVLVRYAFWTSPPALLALVSGILAAGCGKVVHCSDENFEFSCGKVCSCDAKSQADPFDPACCCRDDYGGPGCDATHVCCSPNGGSSGGGCMYAVDETNPQITIYPPLTLRTTEEPIGTGQPDACQAFNIEWGYKSLMTGTLGPPGPAVTPVLRVTVDGSGDLVREVLRPWGNVSPCDTEQMIEEFSDGIAIADAYHATLSQLPISAGGSATTGFVVWPRESCGASGGSDGGTAIGNGGLVG